MAGLAREFRQVKAWRARPQTGLAGMSRRFLTRLRRDRLFAYLSARDRARFERLLRRFKHA